jgi:hypothetical protein
MKNGIAVPRAWGCDEEHTCICVPRPAAGSSCAEIDLVWKICPRPGLYSILISVRIDLL